MNRTSSLMVLVAMLLAALSTAQERVPNSPIDIWHAAAQGNVEVLGRHLANGQDVNSKNPQTGLTPLMTAAIAGQTAAVKFLLANGADANIANNDGSTALHMAALFGRPEITTILLDKGAKINAENVRGQTPLDVATIRWSPALEKLYRTIAASLGLSVKLEKIKASRPQVAAVLRQRGAKSGQALVQPTGYRGAYYKNGEIYVNEFGTPEEKPITSNHWDFKPSWSLTGDMLVFFRRLKNDPIVTNWKTAIYVINVDGTGLHPLSDGTHTDFNPTWTRDGTNTVIWNRRHPEKVSFYVMASSPNAKPGDEYPLTDSSYHTWAYSCLRDGRILVQCNHPRLGWGYYLMTPNRTGQPRFERIDCPLAKFGILDRISISPSETKICFEYQKGFSYKNAGRTLYIADFDPKKPAITNPRAFANAEGANRWFAYPRWTRDEKAIVYHASPSLYMYFLESGRTVRVSTDPHADYRYPHCEAMPK